MGRMLIQSAISFDLRIHILDPNPEAPSAHFAHSFTCGAFTDYDTVLNFGKDCDLITVEIESVNTDALRALKQQGKKLHPDPDVLDLIRDKGLQKQFYREKKLATAPFVLMENEQEIRDAITQSKLAFPFVQKMRKGGYDGKGVAVIRSEADLKTKLLPGPSVIEDLADIKKELAVIVAGSDYKNSCESFDTVEMLFDPEANLVAFLSAPAEIPEAIEQQAQKLAQDLYRELGMRGLLAVEMFWNQDDSLWINEVAPRPHNSGHHSIEACYTSQFEQHLRSILNWPLGNPKIRQAAVMVNLLGSEKANGEVQYQGLEACIEEAGVYPHLYGKREVSPFRKMGHITCLGDTREEAIEKGKKVKNWIAANGQ